MNIELIREILGYASLAVAGLTVIVTLVKRAKLIYQTSGFDGLLDYVRESIVKAEAYTGFSGELKKETVMQALELYVLKNNLSIDTDDLDLLVEKELALTNAVNIK